MDSQFKTNVDGNSRSPNCSPQIGNRYRFPWRDYEEFEVVALPYDGNVIELRSTDDPSKTAMLCRNDMMNWLGNER